MTDTIYWLHIRQGHFKVSYIIDYYLHGIRPEICYGNRLQMASYSDTSSSIGEMWELNVEGVGGSMERCGSSMGEMW